ncbi:hypothetical protein P5673_018837 [Acropora cervicornis]|uniref:Uncharacterized protein n=1 Tax=Acropora cervicornis TaxID=6130 RepID=A0AAD9QCC6_ACRCE|nr:hypothetical protein P5673_018837 [Acropora cervicornis]
MKGLYYGHQWLKYQHPEEIHSLVLPQSSSLVIHVNTSDLEHVMMKWLVPRTFQKLGKCLVYCNFLLEVLKQDLKECLVGCQGP